jgi:hypothetical protein
MLMINQRTFPIPADERDSLTANPERLLDAYAIDDAFASDLRNALILIHLDLDDDEILADCESPRILDLRRCLIALRSLTREQLTERALAESLCPLHLIDYAICFDDDNPECAAIRMIHPEHDT